MAKGVKATIMRGGTDGRCKGWERKRTKKGLGRGKAVHQLLRTEYRLTAQEGEIEKLGKKYIQS